MGTGILRQYDVELIGASRSAIETAESREQFRQAMHDIGLRCVRGEEVSNVSDSLGGGTHHRLSCDFTPPPLP